MGLTFSFRKERNSFIHKSSWGSDSVGDTLREKILGGCHVHSFQVINRNSAWSQKWREPEGMKENPNLYI